MRVRRDDSLDLDAVMSFLSASIVDESEVSTWASRAIDEEEDPPSFLYTMLDLKGAYGRALREEIGFEAGLDLSDEEYHYLCMIATRRGRQPLGCAQVSARGSLDAERKCLFDELLLKNFNVDVDLLPAL